MNVLIARVRVPLTLLGVLLIVVGSFGDVDPLALVGGVAFFVGLICYFWLGRVRAAPVRVQMPVQGRWAALNSPANRVPSHGAHAYGQTYALDLVHEPTDRPRPAFGSGWGFDGFEVDEQCRCGVPRNGEPFVVPATPGTRR